MPAYLTSLIVILAAILGMHAVMARLIEHPQDRWALARMRNSWLLLTPLAFATPTPWLYFLGLALLARVVAGQPPAPSTPREPRPDWSVACWFGLLFAIPPLPVMLGGVGGIEYFLKVEHLRVLNLTLALLVWNQRQGLTAAARGPRWVLTDWAVAAYLVPNIILYFLGPSATHGLRMTMELLLDLFLPYWIVSRGLTVLSGFRLAVLLLAQGVALLSIMGVFETLRGWPLYDGLEGAWDIKWSLTTYLMRDGLFRARATTGHSLALGFVVVLALCLWPWCQRTVRSPGGRALGWAVLVGGLLASLARGPWLGALAGALTLAVCSARPVRNTGLVGAVLGVGVLVMSVVSKSFAELLARLWGTVSGEGADLDSEYRGQLLRTSLDLLSQSPWFGVPDYLSHMEHLRQGQGIIDIVNSYLSVALGGGMVALLPYVLMYAGPLPALWRLRHRLPADDDSRQLASCLIAAIVAQMVMLSAVSSISVIAPMSMAISGLAVAFLRVHQQPLATDRAMARRA